jgi:site-specific recombinase XerD
LKRTASTWLFPSPDGKRWDPDNFSSDLRTANEKAKLSWSCLDFRHTLGSQLAINGESLHKISAILGNNPEICRRHYAARTTESLTDSIEFPGSTAPKTPLMQSTSARPDGWRRRQGM